MSHRCLNRVAILHVHRDRVQVVQPTEVEFDNTFFMSYLDLVFANKQTSFL